MKREEQVGIIRDLIINNVRYHVIVKIKIIINCIFLNISALHIPI